MESLEFFENKLKDYIDRNNKLFNDYNELMKEVKALRQSVARLELDKENIRKEMNSVIEKVELYLNNVNFLV